MGQAVISQHEVHEAINHLARELHEAIHKAGETLQRAGGDVRDIAYRVQAGEAMGIRSSLATLEAFLDISPEAKAALDFFDSHQPPLIR